MGFCFIVLLLSISSKTCKALNQRKYHEKHWKTIKPCNQMRCFQTVTSNYIKTDWKNVKNLLNPRLATCHQPWAQPGEDFCLHARRLTQPATLLIWECCAIRHISDIHQSAHWFHVFSKHVIAIWIKILTWCKRRCASIWIGVIFTLTPMPNLMHQAWKIETLTHRKLWRNMPV